MMRKKAHKRIKITSVVIFAVLLLYLVFLLVPMFTVLISSFVDHVEMVSSTEFIWWPSTWSFDAYKSLFTEDILYLTKGIPSIALGFVNTLWMNILPIVVGLFVSGFAAYAYSKLKIPGKNIIFFIQLATMMIPLGSMAVVSYLYYNSVLGWSGTPLPMMIPRMFGAATTIFFLRMYFESVGDDIIAAAKIDGAGIFRIYVTILIPLAIPAFIAQFIFAFVGGYNEYVRPMLYLTGSDTLVTLQLAVVNLQTSFKTFPEVICSAAVLAMIPLIIVYCFSQKLFIEGITVGGEKG